MPSLNSAPVRRFREFHPTSENHSTPQHSPPRTGAANRTNTKYDSLWIESGQLRKVVDDAKSFGDIVGMTIEIVEANAMLFV